MKKKCKLIIRGKLTENILVEQNCDTIKEAKTLLKEKYYNLAWAEYAIKVEGQKTKWKSF